MAKSDPVKVAVEILDKFSDDLEKLEKQLDRIDGKKLSVDLDIDDNGSIEKVKAQLKALEKQITTDLKVNFQGFNRALMLKQFLQKDTSSTHRVKVNYDNIPASVGEAIENIFGPPGPAMDPEQAFLRSIQGANQRAARAVGTGPEVPLGPMPDRPGMGGQEFDRAMRAQFYRNIPGNIRRNVGRKLRGAINRGVSKTANVANLIGDTFGEHDGTSTVRRLARTLAKHRPTIMMWWQLIALLIPMMITLAGAALGVAAALGAVALAGAAVVGIGMLGYGDTLTGSLEAFQERLAEVKRELFSVFRPVAAAFQPILEGLLGKAALYARRLVDPLMDLSDMEGLFHMGLSGAINLLARFLIAVNDLQGEISQVSARFGRIFGDVLINLFRWAVEEVYNNQEAFLRLAKIFGDIIVIIYNLSRAITFAITVFEPLFAFIAKVSDALSNRFVVGLLSALAIVLALQGAIAGLNIVLGILGWTAIATAVKGLMGLFFTLGVLISEMLLAIGIGGALNAVLATLLSMTGIGLAVVGGAIAAGSMVKGSMPDTGSYGAGSGFTPGMGGTTIIINGDVRNREYQKMRDDFPGLFEEESGVAAAREK